MNDTDKLCIVQARCTRALIEATSYASFNIAHPDALSPCMISDFRNLSDTHKIDEVSIKELIEAENDD